MADYEAEPESGDEGEQAAPTLTIPGFEFDGEPGDIVSFKFLGDGKFQRVTDEEEPPEHEDLKDTLRRDMAAIPPEGEM